MRKARVQRVRRAHHLVLCLFGGAVIGLVESIGMWTLKPVDLSVVAIGWLMSGVVLGPVLWALLGRKSDAAIPFALSAGVAGAGAAAFATNSLAGAFGIPLVAMALAAVHTRRNFRAAPLPGYCWRCRYDLRGLTTPRCPECGYAFDPDELSEEVPVDGNSHWL